MIFAIISVHSPIDNRSLAGITSIRVHRSTNFSNSNHIIRWTEVFVLRSGGRGDSDYSKDGMDADSVDISKLAEQIARSAAMALVSYLDLLSASKFKRIGLRTTLALENVRNYFFFIFFIKTIFDQSGLLRGWCTESTARSPLYERIGQ